ncbi:MAG: hydantoinase B/oxoprolinase family protein, partial [Pseudomonadota bacterium]|nr:hydantoinase B/oxoprolinase family protein [Pseudomonadota bacterium]
VNADPIAKQIIRHQLIAVPNQIEKNIERTAFSPLVQEYKDYSVGFVDAEGRLVAQSRGSLPIFVANALGTAVREGLSLIGSDGMQAGDIVISNTAATLGQHLNNVAAYTPVRYEGELVGFFAVLVHWIDLGGSVPGSCQSTTTTDIWQEGVQYPTIKLVEKGKRREELFRMIATNTRFPRLLMGDLEAQIGGCIMGHDLILDILHTHGRVAVDAAIADMWGDANAVVGRAIDAARAGTYTASSVLDDDGIRLSDRIPVGVSVTVGDGKVKIDLSGIGPQVEGPFNAGRNGGAVAASRIAYKYLLVPNSPVNEGDFVRLNVEIPEGTFLSARPDAPIGGSGAMIPTVVDTILMALGKAFPERRTAAHHGIYGVHSIYGKLPGSVERFSNLDTVTGGWGASATTDGPGPFRSMAHGDVPDIPAELQEAFYPYRLLAKGLRMDSGGPGKFRGGLGVEKIYTIQNPCNIIVKFDRTHCPPWGLEGGAPGATAHVEIHRADGSVEKLTKGDRELYPGDVIRVLSGGGGGFGNPLERPVGSVQNDLLQGYVSPEAARQIYGVVAGDDLHIDIQETMRLRSQMAQP